MSRHRSPRGRGAVDDRPPPLPPLLSAPLPRSPHRHRARPARSRRGATRQALAAAGMTTAALAVVAPGVMQLPAPDAGLALSSDATALGGPRAVVSPVVTPVTAASGSTPGTGSGAATADLFKAGDRVRRQAEAAAAEQARAEAARAAAAQARTAQAEQEARAARSTDCGADGTYGGVAASVRTVGNALECVFPGHDVLGVGSRGNASDHPDGYALDFMTTRGDAIAECVVDHADALGVSYVIWDQRINSGSGWSTMEDRGGATANHEDHVHISFSRGADPDTSVLSSCG